MPRAQTDFADALPALAVLPGAIVLAMGCAGPAAPTGAPVDAAAVFAGHCARCHGADARGTANGPPLRPAVARMSEAAFVAAVLHHSRWSVPADAAGSEGAAREAFVREVLQRPPDERAMPAWAREPAVVEAVRPLYRHLAAMPP